MNPKRHVERRRQWKELQTIKAKLAATSAQDEFAKWAKIRREFDSKQSSFEKASKTLLLMVDFDFQKKKLYWEFLIGMAIRILFYSSWPVLFYSYANEPVFYMASDVFGPFKSLLLFPSCPEGSNCFIYFRNSFWFCMDFHLLLFAENSSPITFASCERQ